MPNPRGGDHDTPYAAYVDYYLSVRQTAALVRLRLMIEYGQFADDTQHDGELTDTAA